jgi:undecaprenyl-diphosphatase
MSGSIQTIDENILFFIQNHMKNPLLDPVMVFITSLGNAGLIWIVVVLIFLMQKRYRKCGIYLAIVLYLSMLLGDEVLKPISGRCYSLD